MTTEATGLAAYTPLSLGTLNETHKVLAAGDVVLFTATATDVPNLSHRGGR